MTPIQPKLDAVRALMDENGLDGMLLEKVSSFAWATNGGASYINTASSYGTSQLLITRDSHHLITNNIEAPRLLAEEGLAHQGWQVHAPHWYERPTLLRELTRGLNLGADGPRPDAVDLSLAMARLRSRLSELEQERFRKLGRLCAQAMDAACRRIQPGWTEFEIAAALAEETERRGAQPIVNLIAVDDRIRRYRHPLPTDRVLERYAMLVLCGRRWGLVVSLTRLVHFGPLPDDLRHRMEACARVDATFIHATRPGSSLDQIFRTAVDAYAAVGFSGEWQLHHQGGPAGFEPREWIATLETEDRVLLGQAYAWNPSITGVKSEDTILVGEQGNEILTAIEGWPSIPVEMGGHVLHRPAILER